MPRVVRKILKIPIDKNKRACNTTNMDRKVYLTVHVPVILRVNEGVEIADVMDQMEIKVTLPRKAPADVEDVGPFNKWEVTDSK